MKVFILGHSGMLGSIVSKYLAGNDIDILTTPERWPSLPFQDAVKNTRCDYLINCIGSIPQKRDDFKVNYELPVWLDESLGHRIIHPGTDCEIDEDEYGISKRRASSYLMERGVRTKIIQSSIIGPEISGHVGLFEWFMRSNTEVAGWTGSKWNGITTLQWAKICYSMMRQWKNYNSLTVPSTDCISKFELLTIIRDVFDKDINIVPEFNENLNKCLNGNYTVPNIRTQLLELKTFIDDCY